MMKKSKLKYRIEIRGGIDLSCFKRLASIIRLELQGQDVRKNRSAVFFI